MNQGQTIFSQVIDFLPKKNLVNVSIVIAVITVYVLLRATISFYVWLLLNWHTVKAYVISSAVYGPCGRNFTI